MKIDYLIVALSGDFAVVSEEEFNKVFRSFECLHPDYVCTRTQYGKYELTKFLCDDRVYCGYVTEKEVNHE